MKHSEDTAQQMQNCTIEVNNQLHEETHFPQDEVGQLSDVTIENLPMQLEVCLAQIKLSLSKVRALTVGMIVPLEIDLTTRLDIAVNGAKCGNGSLVQIGEKIGIQIENWSTEQEH